MQQNLAEKLPRTPQNVKQQPTGIPTYFPRGPHSPRFVVTPESTGMKLSPDSRTLHRELQPQEEVPLVDVKSYYERHNKSMVKIMADCKPEASSSFLSSQSNSPINSYASSNTENLSPQQSYYPSSKTEYMRQSSSPNSSKLTSSPQWSFEQTISNDSSRLSTNNNTINNNNSMQTLKPSGDVSDANSKSLATTPPPQYGQIQNVTSTPEIPLHCTEQQQLPKCVVKPDITADNSATLNLKHLNDVYAKRIVDTDINACGDKDLKICIYKEWVEMLIKINESFITNMEELEKEVAERLELMQKRVSGNCRNSQGNELMKCRKDISLLLKYISDARNYNRWDLQGLTFETIDPSQLLGMDEYEGNGDKIKNFNDEQMIEQKNKLYSNMKALAHEVAEKHDEVRELKRQIVCMEDEIQNAQKKIQLKDDVIKELRSDLRTVNSKLSSYHSLDQSATMAPINYEDQTSLSGNTQITGNTPMFPADSGSQFDSLSHTEKEEHQKIKVLEEEIAEFFEINKDLNKQKMEYQRKRIMDIIEKLETEKAAAYRKLDLIRRQLTNLETDSIEGINDADSGFHSKGENDQDAKILEAVRKRLRKLSEINCDLKKRLQKLELEKNEMANNLQSEKNFSQRNGEILKQVADLLCGMIGRQFSYTDIYNTDSHMNPFCEAIVEMQKEYQNRENQLVKALSARNKQNEQLSQILLKNEKEFNVEREMRMNLNNFEDIDNTTSSLLSISSQTLPATVSSSTEPLQTSTTLVDQPLDSTTAARYLH